MSGRSEQGSRLRLSLSVSTVTRVLVATTVVLVLISYAGQLGVRAFDWHPERDIVSFFNVDRERNLPTSFQTLLFLSCALALAVITVLKRLAGNRWTAHWGLLAVIFAFLGWDEITEVHERFIEPMRRVFELEGIFFFGWIIPAGIALAIFAIVFLRYVLALPDQLRTRFVLAGIIFVTGALVLEAVGGWYYERIDQNADMLYVTVATIEETLEMVGLILFLHALLTYLSELLASRRIALGGAQGRLMLEVHEDSVRSGPLVSGKISQHE